MKIEDQIMDTNLKEDVKIITKLITKNRHIFYYK